MVLQGQLSCTWFCSFNTCVLEKRLLADCTSPPGVEVKNALNYKWFFVGEMYYYKIQDQPQTFHFYNSR